MPGTDINGVATIIKSYCKSELVKQACGVTIDIKIFPESLSGDNGIPALIALMNGFLTLGGFFMQLDAVDTQTLLGAQKDPQKYKTLSVRVSGRNSRFVTLDREWQNMIIERSSSNQNERRYFHASYHKNSTFLHQRRPRDSHDRIFKKVSFTLCMVPQSGNAVGVSSIFLF